MKNKKNKVEKLIELFEENLNHLTTETDSDDFNSCLGKCLAYADSTYVISEDAYLCSLMFQKIDKVIKSRG